MNGHLSLKLVILLSAFATKPHIIAVINVNQTVSSHEWLFNILNENSTLI